jgi:ACS family D-galactonate transporter-like MFS transporter
MAEQRATQGWIAVALLFGVGFVTDIIRVSLGVVAPTLMRLYSIPPDTMGYVLSGWNWAYTGAMLFAGPVVDRFGPWMVEGLGSLLWGTATLALPLVATSAVSLFVMRAFFGLGHSMRIPAQASAISYWFGPEQRSTALGICFTGGQVGLAVGSIAAAFILSRFGWQYVFYAAGTASLVLSVLWFTLFPGKKIRPASDNTTKETALPPVPFRRLLRHRAVWGIAFGQMGYLYAYYVYVNWLPGYLVLERKMSILRTGIVASLPFWAGMLGTLGGGLLGDYLIRRGLSVTASRKWIIGAGMALSAAAVMTAAFTPQTWLAVSLLIACMFCLRATTGAANSLPIDLAPRRAVAALTSIQNFAGNTSGLLAPILTGYLYKTTGSFVVALVVAGMMVLMGAASYLFLVGKVEPLKID